MLGGPASRKQDMEKIFGLSIKNSIQKTFEIGYCSWKCGDTFRKAYCGKRTQIGAIRVILTKSCTVREFLSLTKKKKIIDENKTKRLTRHTQMQKRDFYCCRTEISNARWGSLFPRKEHLSIIKTLSRRSRRKRGFAIRAQESSSEFTSPVNPSGRSIEGAFDSAKLIRPDSMLCRGTNTDNGGLVRIPGTLN